jgi:hypothetical protein
LVAGCGDTSSGTNEGGAPAGDGDPGGSSALTLPDPPARLPTVEVGGGAAAAPPAEVVLTDAELEAIVDEIVADAEAETQPSTGGANAAPLPPSLEDYFDDRTIETWKLALDSPLVKSTCKLAKLPKIGTVLEVAVGLLFQRFRIQRSVKGLSKVVAAANLGCKHLVAPLSERIQQEDAAPLPTPGPDPTSPPVTAAPPPPTIYQATLGEFIPIWDGTTEYGRIGLMDVRCLWELGSYVPSPGYRFVAARVQIDALVEGIPFDTYNWQIEADGVPGVLVPNDDPAWPAFGYGRIHANQGVSGWIVHTVREPQTSIVVRYRGNPNTPEPWFEVPFGPCAT